MTSNPMNLAPEDQFLLWRQELETRQKDQARQVTELRVQATSYGKKTSVCGPSWKPAEPSNHESLLAHSLLPVSARAKGSLHQTISTYWQMMNYPPTVLLSRAVHHLRTPQKPTPEKGHLASPAGPSVSQGVECEENLAGANAH